MQYVSLSQTTVDISDSILLVEMYVSVLSVISRQTFGTLQLGDIASLPE